MKIEGLPQNTSGINTVPGKKLPKPVSNTTAQSADSIALTRAAAGEHAELAASMPEEFPVRNEAVDAAAVHSAGNYYDSLETREKTAERIIDSLDLSASVTTMNSELTEDTVRTGQVDAARTLAASGGYDEPETLAAVAERLTSVLGLTSLLG